MSAAPEKALEPLHKQVLEVLSQRCLGLPGSVQLPLHEQLQEAAFQFAELRAIISKQTFLSGVDPLESLAIPAVKESQHPSLFLDDQEGDWGLPEREEKASLSPEASRLLVSVFAFADALDKAQLTGLAHRASCSEKQVRAFFSKLRTSTRTAIQKAQKRVEKANEGAAGLMSGSQSSAGAVGAPTHQQEWQQNYYIAQLGSFNLGGGTAMLGASAGMKVADPGSAPAATGTAAAVVDAQHLSRAAFLQIQQQQQLENLRSLLDVSGAISSVSNAGHFLLSMQRTSSYQARAQHLSALAATTNTAVLLRLVGSKLLDTFSTWLTEASDDGQLTFLKQALATLRQLPISTPLLQASSIISTVNSLVRHHSPGVIVAAYQLAKHWSSLTSLSTLDALGPLVYGLQEGPLSRSSSGGSGSHGGAAKAVSGSMGNRRGLVSMGSGAVSQRKYSAAVKRKVQELQAGAGLSGGASCGGVASRSDPPARPMSTDDILRKRQRGTLIRGSSGVTSSFPGTSSLPQPSLQGPGQRPGPAAAGTEGAAAGSAAAATTAATHGALGSSQAVKHKPATKVSRLGAPQTDPGASRRAAAQSEAQRRLAALHALSGKAHTTGAEGPSAATEATASASGAGGGASPAAPAASVQERGVPLPVLSPDGVLTSSQRLYHMSPAIIPADYMRRAGHFGNQISQAVQGYNRSLQHWLQERRRHVVREARVMQQAIAHYQQQKQQDGSSSSSSPWQSPPPLLAWTFRGAELWAMGEDSQEAPKQRKAVASVNPVYGCNEDSPGPADLPSDPRNVGGAASPGPVAVLWWPQAPEEKQQQLLQLWRAGVRLPEHIPDPPTADALQRADLEVRGINEGMMAGPAWPVQAAPYQQYVSGQSGEVTGTREQQTQVPCYAAQEGQFVHVAEGSMSQVMFTQPPHTGWSQPMSPGYETWYPGPQ